MGNLLDDASCWLARQIQRHASQTIHYHRGSSVLQVLAIPEGVEALVVSWNSLSSLPRMPVSLTFLAADNCPLSEEGMNNILIQLDQNGQQWGYVDVTGAGMPPSGEAMIAVDHLYAKGWMVMYMP